MDNIIRLTRELGKALQQDDRYIAYALAKQVNDEDEELQSEITRFDELRAEMRNAMSVENPDFDRINAIDKETKALYQKIMSNPHMIVFNSTQKALEKLVSDMNQIITMCANGKDPETCEIPEGCAGNCSACGGCG
ncbi:MAG: YlbF family regulator [Ruminococcus sp.]|nr:YlbF family regulator [Ruminococcus sp.]